MADRLLADSRILSELADAIHLPSHAGAGIGILLTIQHHDPGSRIQTGTAEEPRVQYLRRVCRAGVFCGDFLFRDLWGVSVMVVVFLLRGNFLRHHSCVVLVLDSVGLGGEARVFQGEDGLDWKCLACAWDGAVCVQYRG